MLAQGSYDSVVDNDELEHVPLKQLMKKKAKEKEMAEPLSCQRSEISKSGIKLEKNRKKGCGGNLITSRRSP